MITERPKFTMLSGITARDSPARSARFTVARSFCSAIGFSRKSIAPQRRAPTPFLPDVVFYPNGAVMLLDDPLYDRQPQSGPLGLGGDVGLERPVDDGVGEAATVVADPQPHLATRKLGRHFDLRVGASGKSILRVLQQIVDYLSQAVGVTAHQWNAPLEVGLYPSSGLFVQ